MQELNEQELLDYIANTKDSTINTEHMVSSSLKSLLEKNPRLVDFIKVENGVLTINDTAIFDSPNSKFDSGIRYS